MNNISGKFMEFSGLLVKISLSVLLISALLTHLLRADSAHKVLHVGSKTFTESVILAEIVRQIAESDRTNVRFLKELGGTRVLWNALLKGDIDIYPEYTGTLIQELFSDLNISDIKQLRYELSKLNIGISEPLGFNNTYILGMKKEKASELGITKTSDLRKFPGLKLGFSSEFIDRSDGWAGLKKTYKLPQKDVKGLDHDLAYRGLDSGDIDIIDLYSTDAEIKYYNIRTISDDKKYFPEYKAVYVFRKDIFDEKPDLLRKILAVEYGISTADMISMNSDVKIKGKSESSVVSDFLESRLSIFTSPEKDSIIKRFKRNTVNHLLLVFISLFFSIIIAIPLGILCCKFKNAGKVILSIVGIIQTIPSIALLVFMIPLLGIGFKPAIVALFLYSLLPIVRNTYTGLKDISIDIKESADALGLPGFARLKLIELPIASRAILAGIKTSAVINVGTATLAALIGAGGYGQPIFTGIRLDNIHLVLEGAIPAAVLALAVQGMFDLLELVIVSKGLRLESRSD